jgi:protein-tyrosine sulfotransferase
MKTLRQWYRGRRFSPFFQATETILSLGNLFSRHALKPEHDERLKPVFIIGSGRSGNTLMRALLVAQGEIAIPPESYVLGSAMREFYRYSYLPWHLLARLGLSRFESHPQFHTWKLDMLPVYRQALHLEKAQQNFACLIDVLYSAYAQQHQPQARRWGDKTPMNTLYLDEIRQVFPHAQFIHMLRDGRDVVASYLQSGLFDDLPAAAQRWLEAVESASQLEEKLGEAGYLLVRYENLVDTPVQVMQETCAFLELQYRAEMLDFWQQADQLGDSYQEHHQGIHSPIKTDSIGSWRRKLSEAQQEQVQRLLGAKLAALGYPAGGGRN